MDQGYEAVRAMMMQTTSRTVPGIGVSQEVRLRDGHLLTVLTRHDGSRDVTVESCTVHLGEDEADALAHLLGSGEMISKLARLHRDTDALLFEQLPVPTHSPYAGRQLGDTAIRHRTGASVVAVLRKGFAQPSPKPDYVFEGGDLVLVVGTREALDQVGRILDGTG